MRLHPQFIWAAVLFALLLPCQAFANSSEAEDTLLQGSGGNTAVLQLRALLDSAWAERSNNPARALLFANAAIRKANQAGAVSAEANGYNFLGVIYANTGAYISAKSAFTRALALAGSCQDSVQLGHANNNLADVLMATDDYATALMHATAAVRIFTQLGNTLGLAYTDITLGRLLARQGKYEQCLVYFNRALEGAKAFGDSRMYIRILLETANVYLQLKDYTRALSVYEELTNTYKQQNYRKGEAEAWAGIARLYLQRNDYRQALIFAQRALETDRQIYNQWGVTASLNLLARIYLATGNITEAERALRLAMQSADSLHSGSLLQEVYATRFALYEKMGDYQRAFRYYKEYEALNDSLFREKQAARLENLDLQLAWERAEHDTRTLAIQLQAQSTQRYLLLGIAVFLLLLAVVIIYRYYEKKRLSTKLAELNEVKDRLFNIIAHDLKSPFHAMTSAIDILKNEYAELSEEEKHQFINMLSDASESFSGLLENLLTWSKTQRGGFTLQREQVAVEPLLADISRLLKNTLREKAITIENRLPKGFTVSADENMLRTVLRNVLSNAVKFLPANGTITISGEALPDGSRLTIEDNGPGIKKEALPLLFDLQKKIIGKDAGGVKSSGLGLIICRDFITAHNGTFTVESEEGKFTRVIITLPAAAAS